MVKALSARVDQQRDVTGAFYMPPAPTRHGNARAETMKWFLKIKLEPTQLYDKVLNHVEDIKLVGISGYRVEGAAYSNQ